MGTSQREVYFLEYPPPGVSGKHMHIVLSTLESNKNTSTFVAVMITSSDQFRDDYSFDLNDDMFETVFLRKAGSHVRMHLVTLCLETDKIGNRISRMKPFYFSEMMKTIGEMVFNYDFTPCK